jgi:hypothetical protein
VRRHIAHASNVLSTPVTIVKIPMMRFTFVSIERDDEAVVRGQRGCGLFVRLRLVHCLLISGVDWNLQITEERDLVLDAG